MFGHALKEVKQAGRQVLGADLGEGSSGEGLSERDLRLKASGSQGRGEEASRGRLRR